MWAGNFAGFGDLAGLGWRFSLFIYLAGLDLSELLIW